MRTEIRKLRPANYVLSFVSPAVSDIHASAACFVWIVGCGLRTIVLYHWLPEKGSLGKSEACFSGKNRCRASENPKAVLQELLRSMGGDSEAFIHLKKRIEQKVYG